MKTFTFNAHDFRQQNVIGFFRDTFATEDRAYFDISGHHRDIRLIRQSILRFCTARKAVVTFHTKEAERIIFTLEV